MTEEDARAVRELRSPLRAVFTAASEDEAVQRVNLLLEHARCAVRLARGEQGLRYEFRSGGRLPERVECLAAGELAEALRTDGFERMRVRRRDLYRRVRRCVAQPVTSLLPPGDLR